MHRITFATWDAISELIKKRTAYVMARKQLNNSDHIVQVRQAHGNNAFVGSIREPSVLRAMDDAYVALIESVESELDVLDFDISTLKD